MTSRSSPSWCAFIPQPPQELDRAVGTVEDDHVVLFVGFGTEEYGSLIPLGIGHGLVIAVDLERRITWHPHASVRVVGTRLLTRSGPYLTARHAFPFGIIFILFESLDVALMGRQMG